MIVAKLFGGLGNQLFQYAAARALALRHQTDLLLDLRWFGHQELREPELCQLAIHAAPASTEDLVAEIPPQWTGAGRRQRLRVMVSTRRAGWTLVAERVPGVYDPRLARSPDRCQLVGYWQSERYFADHASTLRAELVPRVPLPEPARSARETISTEGWVSVHVRRGDFAADPQSFRAHGVCPPEYYKRALALLDRELGGPTYVVFSDDPRWANESLDHPRLRFLPELAPGLAAHQELQLMASCRAHVIANSSFSWWGAWLGSHPDKVVVAPKQWFADPALRADDIVPETWLRL